MRHQKKTDKLGRKSDHRAALMSNVVASLIDNDRISTTLRIARSARRYADRPAPLRRSGPPLRQPPGRLHPHPEDRQPPRRRRPHLHPGIR